MYALYVFPVVVCLNIAITVDTQPVTFNEPPYFGASLAANPMVALDNGCCRSHTRSPILGLKSLFRRLYALA